MTSLRKFRLLMVAFAALAVLAPAHADDRPGSFEVRSGSSKLVDGVYVIDARLQFVLSGNALEALDSGVPLNVDLEIEVIRSRRFWLDDSEATLSVNLQLEYHALSQRYLLRNLNSDDQESFATLYAALNHLGRISDLPVIDDSLLKPGASYRVRLRSIMDIKDYPAPLRVLFFWQDNWRLESEWFEWPLER